MYEFHDSLFQLYNDLSHLHQLGQIDRQTRVIIIQMNLYKSIVFIFTPRIITVELVPRSGILSRVRFESFDVDGNYSYLIKQLISLLTFFFYSAFRSNYLSYRLCSCLFNICSLYYHRASSVIYLP